MSNFDFGTRHAFDLGHCLCGFLRRDSDHFAEDDLFSVRRSDRDGVLHPTNREDALILDFELFCGLLDKLFGVIDHVGALLCANGRQVVQCFGIVATSYAEHAEF